MLRDNTCKLGNNPLSDILGWALLTSVCTKVLLELVEAIDMLWASFGTLLGETFANFPGAVSSSTTATVAR